MLGQRMDKTTSTEKTCKELKAELERVPALLNKERRVLYDLKNRRARLSIG